MNKAVFLDRDGVLLNNEHHYYIWRSEQVQFIEGVFENLRMLQANGFQLFIVSNQGGISKGLYTRQDILKLHEEIICIFLENHITVSDILFCSHHPEKEQCLCRKPQGLMIDRLMAKYDICPQESVMIGDSESDMIAASKAGIKGIKIVSNTNMIASIATLIQ